MIKIGVTPESLEELATPASFSVAISDMDSGAERNAAGQLVRDRVAVKRKLSIGYTRLDQAHIQPILKAIQPLYFYVQYPDPLEGTVTKQFYVGDRSTGLYSYDSVNGVWKDLKFEFVER